ncbi:MAG: pentapeptide repeat-containing protein [Deferribacterales bacterium]
MRLFKLTLLLFSCLSLVSCMGGGDGDNTSLRNNVQTIDEVDPEGFWLGYQTIIGVGAYDMRIVIYDGKILGVSEDAGVLFSGTYDMQGSKVLVSDGQVGSDTEYMLYDIYNEGLAFARGIVSTVVDEKDHLSGVFSNENNQEGEIYASYSYLFERGASLSYLTGTYSDGGLNLTVDAAGGMTGTWRGCSMTGTITAPETEKNIYTISYNLSGCAYSGDYTGLGFVSIIGSDAYMSIFADNGSRMDALGFQLSSVPYDFTTERSVTEKTATNVTARELVGGITDIDSDGGDFSGNVYNWRAMTINVYNADFSGASFIKCPINTYTHYLTADDNTKRIDNCDFSNTVFNRSTLKANMDYDPLDVYTIALLYDLSHSYSDVFPIANSDFRYAKFIDSIVEINAYNTDFSHAHFSSSTVYGYAQNSNFTQADFSYTDFEEGNAIYGNDGYSVEFMTCNLKGADFRNAWMNNVQMDFSNMSYANLTDAHYFTRSLTTAYGNAWWTDGSRCAAASVGVCLPKVYDNGLTYDEYLAGKTDLDKDAELIKNSFNEVVNTGKKIVSVVKFW